MEKSSRRRKVKMIDVIILLLISVILGSLGQIAMKKGLTDSGGIELREILSTKLFSIVFQRYVFIGITFYLISTLLWFVILSKAELSFAYPLIALGYIITVFLASIFFKEAITPFRW